MSWHNPEAFLLLIPYVLMAIFWFVRQRHLTAVLKMPKPEFSLKHKGRKYWLFLPKALWFASLFFVIVSLARPQKMQGKVSKSTDGIDIIIALDISDSMLIEDMMPENRLESAKFTISEFIKKRETDRIGLVVFSGEAYTRVPLSLDYELLQENVRHIKTTRNIKMGTAIGVALANAASRLQSSKAVSKIIIFLTDGENNSGTISPETALEVAKGYGVKIYTIGVGKDGMAQLPQIYQGPNGRKVKRYRAMHSKVNVTLLRKMAEETGGKFYRASDGNVLKKVFNDIDVLETTEIEVKTYVEYEELYRRTLLMALASMILAFLLQTVGVRRPW